MNTVDINHSEMYELSKSKLKFKYVGTLNRKLNEPLENIRIYFQKKNI